MITKQAASPAQFQLISDMAKERGIDITKHFRRPESREDAKVIIEWLKGQTRKNTSPASLPQVPDGYYALPAGVLGYDKPHFFKVKNGRRPGFVFLDEQATDFTYPVRNADKRAAVLREIAGHVEAARALYGKLIGRCARCHRTLTDHKNPYFSMGLGPECGSKI